MILYFSAGKRGLSKCPPCLSSLTKLLGFIIPFDGGTVALGEKAKYFACADRSGDCQFMYAFTQILHKIFVRLGNILDPLLSKVFSEHSDQTAQMHRRIWVFIVLTCNHIGKPVPRLISYLIFQQFLFLWVGTLPSRAFSFKFCLYKRIFPVGCVKCLSF